MKHLFIIALSLVGCYQTVIVDHPAPECRPIAVAYANTDKVNVMCEQLQCDKQIDEITFRCTFHNNTDEIQPGPVVRLNEFSEKTNALVFRGDPVYGNPIKPGATDIKYINWVRASTE